MKTELTMQESLKCEQSIIFLSDFSEHTLLAVAHSNNCKSALKKQIPNSRSCLTDSDSVICGSCDSDIDTYLYDYEYCPYCGQKL